MSQRLEEEKRDKNTPHLPLPKTHPGVPHEGPELGPLLRTKCKPFVSPAGSISPRSRGASSWTPPFNSVPFILTLPLTTFTATRPETQKGTRDSRPHKRLLGQNLVHLGGGGIPLETGMALKSPNP